MHFIPIQDFIYKNMHLIRNKEIFDCKVFKVIYPKTYLNHELASKFLFLSDLAYKLVNLLVFEKKSSKVGKNWT